MVEIRFPVFVDEAIAVGVVLLLARIVGLAKIVSARADHLHDLGASQWTRAVGIAQIPHLTPPSVAEMMFRL